LAPSPASIDEQFRRRPNFAGGYAVMLPDGQTWEFFEPEVAMRPATDPRGRTVLAPAWTFGPDIDPETDRMLSAGLHRCFHETTLARDARLSEFHLLAYRDAAWLMLSRNYVIDRGEFEALVLGALDPTAQELLQIAFRSLATCAYLRMIMFNERVQEWTDQSGIGVDICSIDSTAN
jgi:hypothetical protein